MVRIAPDKWKHFFVGIALGLLFHLGTIYVLGFPPFAAFLLAFIGVVIVGYGFELFSLVSGLGHYDLMDAVATVIGGLPGLAVCWLF
ncbi:MAG: hypothetical protein EOO13_06555 [Chitinophagaceae bacterium]|nr:MAG: hypothetical protein EOO13_06555 [Chitinophagaceae bacterium]